MGSDGYTILRWLIPLNCTLNKSKFYVYFTIKKTFKLILKELNEYYF